MTKENRVRAFAMRCDGMTWEQIGEELHYDSGSVSKALHTVLEAPKRVPRVRFPAMRRFLAERCDNSIQVFAGMLGVSPHRLRRVLVHGDRPPRSMCRKIEQATGLPEGVAFAPDPEERGGDDPCSRD